MPAGAITAYGGTSVPANWLLCDGSSYLRASYPDLDAVLSAESYPYGSADGTHFNVPDLRQRFIIGKAASGTGSTLGGTGGNIDHTHTGPSHTHGVTEAADHTAHSVTQPSAHSSATHSGAAVTAHSALAHSGVTVSNHSIGTEASAHGSHTTDGAHTHDAHTTSSKGSGSTAHLTGPATHSSVGGHTHDAHSAHSSSTVDAHADVTGSHAADTHTVSAQPADHTGPSHSGTTVTAAHSHSGSAFAAAGTGVTGTANPGFQTHLYIIRAVA